jgi:myo-inositol catabolism protein IolC
VSAADVARADAPAARGYGGELYFLAFDHRGVFSRSVLDVDEPTPEDEATIADCKAVILEGLRRAIVVGGVPPERLGVLVDELYGAEVARDAKAMGAVVTMPVEEPDQDVYRPAYGEDFGAHVAAFQPDFAKVLVRYNAEGPTEPNRVQLARLRELSDWLTATGRRFLFELITVPTAHQLAQADGDVEQFEREQRPALIRRAMAAIQDAGVEVDVWKLEGIDDPDDAAATVAQARNAPHRRGVACIVLGAGASQPRVDHWLRVAAATEGFVGFAIGRSIWRAPLRALLAGEITRAVAAERIAQDYLRFVGVYRERADVRG